MSSTVSLIEHKKYCSDDKRECDDIVPSELLSQVSDGENRKDDQGDDFLDSLELSRGKLVGPDPVCRHLETVFREGDQPAQDDRHPQRRLAESQVSIPRKGHENIRDSE